MRRILSLFIAGLVAWNLFSGVGVSQDATLLRLGLAKTLFRDVRDSMIDLAVQPLSTLLTAQAGVPGKVEAILEPVSLAQQLEEKKVDLAVMHGVEFAWAKQKHPELKPLLVVNNGLKQRAVFVVSASSNAKTPQDLKGKQVSLPRRSKEHLHLFLQRRCTVDGKLAPEFFKVSRPLQAEYALNEVVRGESLGAVVDLSQLDAYKASKPEKAAKLKVLLESETFPSAVICYRQGGVSETSLQRVKNGLLHLHESQESKEMLNIINMQSFEAPPVGFEQLLQSINRAYPPLADH